MGELGYNKSTIQNGAMMLNNDLIVNKDDIVYEQTKRATVLKVRKAEKWASAGWVIFVVTVMVCLAGFNVAEHYENVLLVIPGSVLMALGAVTAVVCETRLRKAENDCAPFC